MSTDQLHFDHLLAEQTMINEEKRKDLESAMSQIERQFGKGSIMKLGDQALNQVSVIGSGNLGLDIALGVGGYPRGRIIEIYGPESSGKTTMALCAVAEVQRAGGVAAFIDAEHALDISNARLLGVNVEEMLVAQPDYGEQALEIAEQLVRVGKVDIVVVDSVAALVPKGELDGDMGDSHMGLHARLMSQALRKLTGSVSKSQTIFVFINQLRLKIGVMFGNPETTTGGNALKFYASVRLDVRSTTKIKQGDEIRGHRIKIKVVKNKVAPPFRNTELDLIYGEGISHLGTILDYATEGNIVQKSGTWFSFDKERLGQGRDNAIRFLAEHTEIAQVIESRVRQLHGLIPTDAEKSAEEKAKAASD